MLSIRELRAWDVLLIFVVIAELALPHSLVSIVALMLFAIHTIHKSIPIGLANMNKLIAYYALFIAYGFLHISLGWSSNPAASVKIMRTTVVCLVFCYLLSLYIRETTLEQLRRMVFIGAMFACATILALTYVRTGTFILRGGEEDLDNGINSNACAMFSAFAIVWAVCTSSIREKKLIVCVLFMLAFSALAGTRKSYLFVMLGWMIFTIMNKPSKMVRNIIVVGLVVLLAYWAIMNIPFLYANIGVRFETLINMQQGGEGDDSEKTRALLVELGRQYIAAKPWKGYGIDTFRVLHGGLYSHNNYIELMYGLGIPGAVLFYLMYAHALRRSVKELLEEHRSIIVLSLALLVGILFVHYAQVVYYSRTSLVMLFAMYAMIQKADEEDEDDEDDDEEEFDEEGIEDTDAEVAVETY